MTQLVVGSVHGERTHGPVHAASRRKCWCCKRRATHYGLNNGVVLTMGCEWYVRQWCRDPWAAIAMARRASGQRQMPASDE